jgi:hypothetical protein
MIAYLKSRSSGAEMRALMRVRQATRSGSLFLMRRPCTIGWNRSRPFTSPAIVIASRVWKRVESVSIVSILLKMMNPWLLAYKKKIFFFRPLESLYSKI